MQCRKVRKDLTAYLDGELPARRQRRVAAHLAGCRGCRGEVRAFRAVMEAMQNLPEGPRDSLLTADTVLGRFAAREERDERVRGAESGRSSWLRPAWRPALALAGILCVVALWQAAPVLRELPVPTEEDLRIAEEVELYQEMEVIQALAVLEAFDDLRIMEEELG